MHGQMRIKNLLFTFNFNTNCVRLALTLSMCYDVPRYCQDFTFGGLLLFLTALRFVAVWTVLCLSVAL
jgi:hypothetical protein